MLVLVRPGLKCPYPDMMGWGCYTTQKPWVKNTNTENRRQRQSLLLHQLTEHLIRDKRKRRRAEKFFFLAWEIDGKFQSWDGQGKYVCGLLISMKSRELFANRIRLQQHFLHVLLFQHVRLIPPYQESIFLNLCHPWETSGPLHWLFASISFFESLSWVLSPLQEKSQAISM